MNKETEQYLNDRMKEQQSYCVLKFDQLIRESVADRFYDFGMQLEEMREYNKKQDKKLDKLIANQDVMMKQQDEVFPKYQVAKYLYKGALWTVGTGAVFYGAFVALKDFLKK